MRDISSDQQSQIRGLANAVVNATHEESEIAQRALHDLLIDVGYDEAASCLAICIGYFTGWGCFITRACLQEDLDLHLRMAVADHIREW